MTPSDTNARRERLADEPVWSSARLEAMVAYVGEFLDAQRRNDGEFQDGLAAAADFCIGYPDSFRAEFLGRLGASGPALCQRDSAGLRLSEFNRRLVNREGECIFLLRDAFCLMQNYQSATGKGFGIQINRALLCKTEADYFELVNLVYIALRGAKTYREFEGRYFDAFARILQCRPHVAAIARELSVYVSRRASSHELTFVDTGSQFTFALFCLASLRHFVPGKFKTDVYAYSAYPWLARVFDDRHFAGHSRATQFLEVRGRASCLNALSSRASATLLGFAIGDALGFPVAGVASEDVPELLGSTEIRGFRHSPRHPYFARLCAGQYTSNTILMRLTAEHLARYRGFHRQEFLSTLKTVAISALAAPDDWRWVGPTTLRAFAQLADPGRALSSTLPTRSCAAAYRAVPFGLLYRPMTNALPSEALALVSDGARITHNSDVSAAGAVFVADLVGDLVSGVLPETAVLAAIEALPPSPSVRALVDQLRLAFDLSGSASVDKARAVLGTGSNTDQTLPLAVFCFLEAKTDFERAVLHAANSIRVDNPEARASLAGKSRAVAMVEARGGNTDGIAALTGAFSGAHLGASAIPPELRAVEDADDFMRLGCALALQFSVAS